MKINLLVTTIILLSAVLPSNPVYSQGIYRIQDDFDKSVIPQAADYEKLTSWAAHPDKVDMADTVPQKTGLQDNQRTALADVFFIYPTIFTYEPMNKFRWNAEIPDEALNNKVDNSTILNQATAFNGSCRVFAPRYRQAHYTAFTTDNPENKKQSLDVAYEDVRNAFEYYLKNCNNGRPIVIAAHSQGTIHAGRLIKEFIDGKPLQQQFVEAYLIGIATPPDYFDTIKPSNSADDTGGFVTWNTFEKDFYPDYYKNGLNNAVCTNPLLWTTDETYASRDLNKGGIGLNFKFVERPADAQVHDGMLWIHKPYITGRMFIKTKVWHMADINLFWMNIRENVALRVDTFLAKINKQQ